ncbi:MAG: hypothetical protein AAGI15_06480 [Pseudomonadota bacterium]
MTGLFRVPRQTVSAALLVGTAMLGACAHDDQRDPCAGGPSQACLIARGQAVLDASSDPFVRASGAAALALAYDVAEAGPETAQSPSAAALAVLREGLRASAQIAEDKTRGAALEELMSALGRLAPRSPAQVAPLREALLKAAGDTPAAVKLAAQATRTQAVHGQPGAALTDALALPQADAAAANAKAVALRALARTFAEQGDFERALTASAAITMSITYYQAMARTDLALQAQQQGNPALADRLLMEAERIGRSQDNGYFRGAVLREIAYAQQQASPAADGAQAQASFTAALAAAATAPSAQERARATSRIATRMADAALTAAAARALAAAGAFAEGIEPGPMQTYTTYELAGTAAFSGDFDQARAHIRRLPATAFGSARSVRAAARRDLAWGLVRHRRPAQALAVCEAIASPREQIQAFARAAVLLTRPQDPAPARYL